MMKMLLLSLCLFLVKGATCDHINSENVNQAALVGKNVTLSCAMKQNGVDILHNNHQPKKYNVTWKHTPVHSQKSINILEVEIDTRSHPQLVYTADGNKYYTSAKDASLIVLDIDLTDAGLYTCLVQGDSLLKNSTADLFVLLPPQCHNLIPSFTYQNGDVNQQTLFDCSVHYRGNQPPIILWKHDKQELNTGTDYHNNTFAMATLSFKPDKKYDGYRFLCLVEYPSAKFLTACQTKPPLQIYYPVHLNKMIIKYVYNSGKTINLDCQASGNPHPKYRWTFKPKGDNSAETILATEPRYTITDADKRNEGTYNCTVTNNINGTLFIDTQTKYIKINDENSSDGKYRFVIIQSSQEDNTTPNPTTSAGVSPYAIGAVICAVLAVILILVFVILGMKFRDQCFLMQMRDKRTHTRLTRDHDENMDDQEIELLDESVQSSVRTDEPQYGRLKLYWEIPRKDIRLVEEIAAGSFVEVWKGKMKKYPNSSEIQKVAIKKLIENATEQERKFFLGEMEVQKMLQPHPNVILLIGCYTFHEPWLLMLEYAQEGTLYEYLQYSRPGAQTVQISSNSVHHKNINSHRLLAIAAQVVNGLMHLQKFKLIYYRLKTSNILVGRGGICKLTGFGFPHEITERNQYENDTLPVEWMSPESLREQIYNYRTDIWSYGVLLWEIIHFGLSPYLNLEREEIEDDILSGKRLERPPHCSEDLYQLMLDCWQEDPMKRKEYPDILQVLSNMAADHSLHILLSSLPDMCKFTQAV
ncbi:fibroblast growth factor receptor-like [Mytilus edulis]|uniref:fibroblast growth factor receptor-like n=1 Tax=Mytilus edulis TaxID=6550 RepID=UPI0039F0BE55